MIFWQAERTALLNTLKDNKIERPSLPVGPVTPMQPPTPVQSPSDKKVFMFIVIQVDLMMFIVAVLIAKI